MRNLDVDGPQYPIPHPIARVRLNLGTRGASVSFGHRGAWYTVGPGGRRTATLGWPGTGLRWTETTGGTRPPGVLRPAVPPAPSAAGGLVLAVLLVLIGIAIGRALG